MLLHTALWKVAAPLNDMVIIYELDPPQCGAGSGPPYLSKPSPGCPLPGDIAQLFSSITKQFMSVGIDTHAGGSTAADMLPPPIWNFCQSIWASLSPSEYPIITSAPDEECIPPRGSFGIAERSIYLPRTPACCSASIRSKANSEASIVRPTSAMLMAWKFPTLSSATSAGQFTYNDRGKTALSTRSSRQRSRAVSRLSFKSRSSVMAALFCAVAILLSANRVSACNLATVLSDASCNWIDAVVARAPNIYSAAQPPTISKVANTITHFSFGGISLLKMKSATSSMKTPTVTAMVAHSEYPVAVSNAALSAASSTSVMGYRA